MWVNFHPWMPTCLCSRHVCMDLCCLLYLDKSEEMWVAIHLPPCELKVVFFFPTVMLIGREALMELGKKGKYD